MYLCYFYILTDLNSHRGRPGLIVGVLVVAVISIFIIWNYCWKREKTEVTLQTGPPNEMESGALTTPENIALPIINNGHEPIIECGSVNNNDADPGI